MYVEDLVPNYVYSQRAESIAQEFEVRVKSCDEASDEIVLTGVLEVESNIHSLDRVPDGWASFLEFRGSRHELTLKAEMLQDEFIEAFEDQKKWVAVAELEDEIRRDFLNFAERSECEDPVDDVLVRVDLELPGDLFNAEYLVSEREAALLVNA
jgi:hypothetical protein